MKTLLHGTHQETYDAIFQHPVARNLDWRNVRSMLESLAEAVQTPSGKVKFTRNGHTLTLALPKGKNLPDVDDVMRIRHFLKESETPQQSRASCYLVVIDHRHASVFKSEAHGTIPARILPHDAANYRSHLHNVENYADGQRRPELKAFYEQIARELEHAPAILIFGEATGSSSAMDYLVNYLKQSHPAIADRIVGTVAVNEKHLTDDQLLAQARALVPSKAEQ